jgi:hypothetical protein
MRSRATIFMVSAETIGEMVERQLPPCEENGVRNVHTIFT